MLGINKKLYGHDLPLPPHAIAICMHSIKFMSFIHPEESHQLSKPATQSVTQLAQSDISFWASALLRNIYQQ